MTETPTKKTRFKKAVSKKTKEDLVNAALNLAAERGWSLTSLSDIAEEAGVSLGDLRESFEDRSDVLVAYGRMIDQKVLKNIGAPDFSMSERDRLFEILMERFDVVNENREAVLSILQSFKGDPKQAVISLPHLAKSMAWMLEAASIDTTGYKGALRVAGLKLLYLNVLRTWMDDESEDMSKTMSALDKNLNRAEQVMNSLPF